MRHGIEGGKMKLSYDASYRVWLGSITLPCLMDGKLTGLLSPRAVEHNPGGQRDWVM
jgi:hypothetical protein